MKCCKTCQYWAAPITGNERRDAGRCGAPLSDSHYPGRIPDEMYANEGSTCPVWRRRGEPDRCELLPRIRLAINKLRDRMRAQQLEALAATYQKGRVDTLAILTALAAIAPLRVEQLRALTITCQKSGEAMDKVT